MPDIPAGDNRTSSGAEPLSPDAQQGRHQEAQQGCQQSGGTPEEGSQAGG